MNRIDGIEPFTPPQIGVVLTIGNFDGVHRGHRALVQRARELARPLGAPVAAMTFEPHPLAIVRPASNPGRLTTADEKVAWLSQIGVDVVIVLPSDAALLSKSPAEFLDGYVLRCRPRAVVEGPTFRFGRDRAGSVNTLRAFGAAHGFEVCTLDVVRCERIEGQPTINSSAIRAALCEGRLSDANAMLGRAHRITGRVTRGDRRGAPLGFPTANLTGVSQLLPRAAVFAGIAQLESGALHAAAVNIGPQPTFGQAARRIEAHLLGFAGELHGRRVGVHLLGQLRTQRRFDSADALVQQLRRDVDATRALVSAAVLESTPRIAL